MVDFDRKFLFQKINLAVVGQLNEDLMVSLEYLGFKKITRFGNQKLALSRMKDEFFGMIVCFETPEVSCLNFIKILRITSSSASRFSPILFISPQTMITKQSLAKARDCGVTEIMTYPASTITLRDKIATMLEFPRNFIISRGYVGPDRRRQKKDIEVERRKE